MNLDKFKVKLATIAARDRKLCERLTQQALNASFVHGVFMDVKDIVTVYGTVYIAYVQVTDSVMTLQSHLELVGAERQHVFEEGADLKALFE